MTNQFSRSQSSDITCHEVADWTSAYLDEHLDDPSKVRMALHLAICAGCDAYVKQIAAVRDMVGLLPGESGEPAHLEKLRQAFSAHRKRPQSTII